MRERTRERMGERMRERMGQLELELELEHIASHVWRAGTSEHAASCPEVAGGRALGQEELEMGGIRVI